MTQNNTPLVNPSQLRSTSVDLGGLMTVLGRHLYSTPVVALRELVQNAHDSIIRRRLEDVSPSSSWDSRIIVRGDHSEGRISIIDTGAGLTEQEVHQYLATVGQGYTRRLRQEDDSNGLIGMFGLGFLSAFVLADEVIVTTTSYQSPDQGWQYRSSTGERYILTPVEPRRIGSEVTLVLKEDFRHLASSALLKNILGKYCVLLREPVFINDGKEALNPDEPPWRIPEGRTFDAPVWLHRKRLEFASRFDSIFEPLCVIPIIPPAEMGPHDSDVSGLLWVQDGATYGTGDNRQISVFGRGMLLDDDARDLLPSWAGFISGVVESDRLTPTASREDLQKDDEYYAAQRAISEALVTGLARVARSQPESWRRVMARHNDSLLGAALADERLFDLLADSVNVQSSQGPKPAAALKTGGGLIHIRLGTPGGFEDMLFTALKTPVARGDLYAVLPFLRKWVESRGGRLVELGTDEGNKRLFTQIKLPDDELDFLKKALGHGEALIPARFQPAELPMVIVHDREAELKKRLEEDEADRRISAAVLALARSYTARIDDSAPTRLYVNMDNPAVAALLQSFRSGGDGGAGAGFLRAMKVIMAAGESSGLKLDVNEALGDFSRLASAIINADIPTSNIGS
ncbi:molecular chaperone HtpG [Deltaproteobacteria bacterium Smac51]|nr:molecular chaperone HtpG [Deltaproteobacteria bacterium Smac51]